MGCGASQAAEVKTSTTQIKSLEEQQREVRRDEVLEKYRLSEKDKSRIIAYPSFKIPVQFMQEHEIQCGTLTDHVQKKRQSERVDFVFFGTKDETCTECTVFFVDQDVQTKVTERHGSSFSLIKDDLRTSYSKVAFHHSWSGDETWKTSPNDDPHTHTLPYSALQLEDTINGARPIFFLNTSTRLLGAVNNNPDLELATISEYKMYSGTARQAAEITHRASEVANPDKKEVSPLAQLIPVRTTHAPSKKKA
eukprot:NODE_2051_length_998_cov_292.760801_g1673_i0.p2 GENE.NODE_2051_length_998_cov_292.760801_g1673_i0~~NODE_2051_length_998_cov_292.760801_g1673_i0.p2  ORF type:complete len:251 (-),score=59.99 NODE_2051_length_998_cov_292.760801_g1673_i0:161-913(-)